MSPQPTGLLQGWRQLLFTEDDGRRSSLVFGR